MSTKPKHNSTNEGAQSTSHTLNPQNREREIAASSNYDASRIFRFEAYSLKLRMRAATGC